MQYQIHAPLRWPHLALVSAVVFQFAVNKMNVKNKTRNNVQVLKQIKRLKNVWIGNKTIRTYININTYDII